MDTFGTSTTRPPFEVTTAAVDQITALGAVRLSLAAGRCCGTTYVFTQVADERAPGVTRFGCAGAWLHVDDDALDLLRGARLDYTPQSKPPRFRVLANPNTPQVCPCRRSFGPEGVAGAAPTHLPRLCADALGRGLRATGGLGTPHRLLPGRARTGVARVLSSPSSQQPRRAR